MSDEMFLQEIGGFSNFEAVLNSIGEDIAIIDTQYNITFQNNICKDAHGDNLGEKCYSIFAQQDNICPNCPSKKVFENGEITVSEHKSYDQDGNEHHVEIVASPLKDKNGQIISSIEVVRDVTKRKKTEEALLIRQNKFMALFDKAPLSYHSLDETGCLLAVNEVWLESLGYNKEEVLGKSFGDFLNSEGQNCFKENFFRFKKDGEISGAEFEVFRKDGTKILMSLFGKIGKNPDGSFQQSHCIMHDITKERKAENEKKALIEDLKKALEEIETLRGIIPICSHCKNIRDDRGFWDRAEKYIEKRTEAKFSHGVCPDCLEKYYSEISKRKTT